MIKVKYGDTLRRFSAYVQGNSMDLDMAGLRAKILNLFNLNSDADLTLTYIDEDGDVVTLVDDTDLRDAAILQRLNPLRITVLLNTSRTEPSSRKSQSDSSSSTRSPRAPIQLPPRIAVSVEDSLKSVPEPLLSALLKISNDLVSKATSSSPVLTELVEYCSNLGQCSQGQDGTTLSKNGSSSQREMDLNVAAGTEASNHPVSVPKVKANLDKNPADNPKDSHVRNMTRGMTVSTSMSTPVDLNLNLPKEDPVMSGCPSADGSVQDGNSFAAVSSLVPPMNHLMDHYPYPLQSSETLKQLGPQIYGSADALSGEKNKQPPGWASARHFGFNPLNNCPANSQIGADATDTMFSGGLYPAVHPFRKSYGHYDNMLRTFHRGIRCDGCGMHPIMGPRFKSKVKDDYDLCNICFEEIGNDADYTRIDRATYRHPRFPSPCRSSRFHTHSSHAVRGCGVKPARTKLESRFIQDVTIIDGTMMAPGTHFTKIWRMRNNGTAVWPSGTQLVWMGGDNLSDKGSAELEIPVDGCAVNEELDIAVDFIAPLRPGRYISYWRMASPSGQKFGQRVWVLIQVDAQLSSLSDSFSTGLNLNLPPESNTQKGKRIAVDVNVDPIDVGPSMSNPNEVATESVKPVVDETLSDSHDRVFPVDSTSLIQGNGVAPPASAPISYPIIDFPEPSPAIASPPASASMSYPIIDFSEPSPAMASPHPSGETSVGDTVEQTLLKELEEMGFKQIDLNLEILRNNEYNLEQSVDDLCGVSEWDPMLEELQEMGFNDREMNKKLLKKNGGSIKRVVLDLIAGENA